MKIPIGVLLLALPAGACRSVESDDWRFRLSREFYGSMEEKTDSGKTCPSSRGAGSRQSLGIEEFGLFVALLALPLALDLVLLPVTIPRDYCAG